MRAVPHPLALSSCALGPVVASAEAGDADSAEIVCRELVKQVALSKPDLGDYRAERMKYRSDTDEGADAGPAEES